MRAAKTVGDEIHVLPVSILTIDRARVDEFRRLAAATGVRLGWHYLLDLSWAADRLVGTTSPGGRILDAGAGVGLMQWWMAERGFDVISVDRDARYFSRRLRGVAPIVGLTRPVPSMRRAAARRMTHRGNASLARWAWRAGKATPDLLLGDPAAVASGKVLVASADLRRMPFVESGSVDAVVSISSLEHNTPESLRDVVAELTRVLKPGGPLIATVGSARDRDWFHEPSQGWCFTETTLRKVFGLDADCPSNYDRYDELMSDLRANEELRDGLAPSYFRSGENGMPWGRWDPQYLSVGIVKVKASTSPSEPRG